MEVVKKINRCVHEGKPWGNDNTIYESKLGAPMVTALHKKGHRFDVDAAPEIVKFFKSQSKD